MAWPKPKTTFILYHYDPSTPAAVVFITLFAITTLLHIFQMVKAKTWYFIPFVIGGICMSFPFPVSLAPLPATETNDSQIPS